MKRSFLALLAGLSGGLLAVIAGLLILRTILRLIPNLSSGWEDLIYALLVVIVLYPLGVGLAAGLVLRRTAGRGMVWKALLAAYMGEGLILLLAEPLRLNVTSALLMGLLFLSPPLMVFLAYRLNRPAGEGE